MCGIIFKNEKEIIKMKKITDRKFFERKSEDVARDLIGKYICYNGKSYQIIETEAYYYNEQDENGKYFCYGVKDATGEYSKTYASIPLFRIPGTWCIYGGQLLVSVTSDKIPDNVLIKKVAEKTDNNYLGPDKMAVDMKLYQKCENSNYWDFHGLDPLLADVNLYLSEYENQLRLNIKSKPRVNIRDNKSLNFFIESKVK